MLSKRIGTKCNENGVQHDSENSPAEEEVEREGQGEKGIQSIYFLV